MKEKDVIIDRQLYERRMHGTPLFSFATYRMVNASETLFVTSHWHREIEILCFQQGCAQVLLNGREYQAQAGDVIFINQGELHQITSSDPTLLYHACDFPIGFLSFADPDYGQSHYIDPLADKELFFCSFISHTQTQLRPVYDELLTAIHAHEAESPGYQLRIKGCLLKVISCLIESDLLLSAETRGEKVNAAKIKQLKEIVTYIQGHYAQKLYLKDIAAVFHMSDKYFSNYFKQNFGVPFIEYLINFRIEKACSLLTTTDIAIMEISFATGFLNFSYFIRKFREVTGYSPSEYRSLISESK